MTHTYKTHGTCSVAIDVEMDGDTVKEVQFHGGCNGNTKGIASLVKGMKYSEVKERLAGITCGHKTTSCPDQLVKAIEEAMANE